MYTNYQSAEQGMNEARMMINQLSVDDLKRIMNDDNELNRFVQKLPEVQQMSSIQKSLEDRVKSLAQKNLEKEPILREEKKILGSLHRELAQKKEAFLSKGGSFDEKADDESPEVILAMLRSAASDLENSTEQMGDAFFYTQRSEKEVSEFARRFIEDRQTAHELKIKAEKFHELLQSSRGTSYLSRGQYYH